MKSNHLLTNILHKKEQENFKCYTWPNLAFPFRLYFENDKCRIFIIENLAHNYKWLKEYRSNIRSTDFFFIIIGCHYDTIFKKDKEIFEMLDLNIENFFYMCNSKRDLEIMNSYSLYGDLINHNCWLDENRMNIMNCDKKYDAIYVARLISLKRHNLASKIQNLAIVAGLDSCHKQEEILIPPHTYKNKNQLSSDQVCEKINESKCGLILSKQEGACFASSEYLLCGIPVVSTKSLGGRDEWYNDYNSIVCEDNEDSVKESVDTLIKRKIDPYKIRQMHIDQSVQMRKKFISKLKDVFYKFGIMDIDAESYFHSNFFHKMRTSYTPNFDSIFKSEKIEMEDYLTTKYNDINIFYLKELDGGGRTFGQAYIPIIKQMYGKVGRVYEWCSGCGFIGFSLLANGLCDSLCLSDINPKAVEALKLTVELNNLQDKVSVYLSDGLKDIPETEKWDLVISNPPHKKAKNKDIADTNILLYDEDWKLHNDFYCNVSKYLNDTGTIIIQENSSYSNPNIFLEMIQSNLDYIGNFTYFKGQHGKQKSPSMYYMVSRKKIDGIEWGK